MLKKLYAIIVLVKKCNARHLKLTQVWTECEKTVEDALELDKYNGNAMWSDAIAKKMRNV